jgi:hypothetical protein
MKNLTSYVITAVLVALAFASAPASAADLTLTFDDVTETVNLTASAPLTPKQTITVDRVHEAAVFQDSGATILQDFKGFAVLFEEGATTVRDRVPSDFVVAESVAVPGGGRIFQLSFFSDFEDGRFPFGLPPDFPRNDTKNLWVGETQAGNNVTNDFITTIGARVTLPAGYQVVVNSVLPEPSSWLLFGTGVVGLLGFAWRRRTQGA